MSGPGAQEARAEQEALRRVARAVADSATPERTFALVAREVANLFSVEAGVVWRFAGSSAEAVGAWGTHQATVGTMFPLSGDGAIPQVWSTGRPARARYADLTDDDPTRRRVAHQGYRSGVAAPVRARGRLWGAVLVSTTQDRELEADVEERLTRFAELLGSSLVLTEDQHELAERSAEQAALRRVATAVAEGTAPDHVFTLVCREAAELTGGEIGGVLELTGEAEAVLRASWRGEGPALPVGMTLRLAPEVAAGVAQGRPARSEAQSGAGAAPDWRAQFGDVVSVPIMIEGRPWGLCSVASRRGATMPGTAEARLQRFAELAATAIANAESQRALHERAAEQTALRRVATAVAADSGLGAVFSLACREAAALLGAASGIVIRLEGGGTMVVADSWQADGLPAPPEGLSMPMTDSAMARDLLAGRPTIVPAGAIDPGPWRAAYGDSVVAPVRARDGVWGLLCVSPPAGTSLPAGSGERLAHFAELLGAAITSAGNRRTVIDAAEEQAALREVATAIAADAEPEEVFDLVCRAAARLLGVASAGVMRLLADDRAQVVANWTAEGFAAPALHGIENLADYPGRADDLRAGSTARFPPDDRSPAWLRGFADVAAAPIVLDGETWGLLGVASADGPITDGMEARLGSFADLVGVAIASAETRRRSVDEAAALIAGGGLDMDATLRAIVASARRALGADRATCFVLSDDGTGFEGVHTTDDARGTREAIDAGAATPEGRELLQGLLAAPSPMIEREDVSLIPAERDIAARFGVGAYLTIRLEHPSVASDPRGPTLGVLFISFAAPRRFNARDRVAARSLASIAELALANARLHGRTLAHLAQAEQRAATDPLTGLANHRVFHERLREEAESARREARPLSLALFDLDHFAAVNALHGHEAGDRIIAEVAARLAGEAGADATLARIGGEEFAWLLPGADSLEAWAAADRVREAVHRDPLGHGERLTLSAGVAELAQGRDASELLRLAEGALYWAKAHGRDVTFLYSPEVVEELSAEERVTRLERSQALNAIRVLARAVDTKDPSTREHSERVAELADLIARELGWIGERRALLREAGLVHDVGKIGIPDSILFKPDRLAPDEYERVKQHAELGAQIVADVLTADQVAWVRSHHERVDGTGYPDGLAGDAIPMGARILAVADAWDVMITARPYSAPISAAAAGEECRRMAGTQFSPEVVAALERLVATGIAPVTGGPET